MKASFVALLLASCGGVAVSPTSHQETPLDRYVDAICVRHELCGSPYAPVSSGGIDTGDCRESVRLFETEVVKVDTDACLDAMAVAVKADTYPCFAAGYWPKECAR
jgi:hypothetical protein